MSGKNPRMQIALLIRLVFAWFQGLLTAGEKCVENLSSTSQVFLAHDIRFCVGVVLWWCFLGCFFCGFNILGVLCDFGVFFLKHSTDFK